MDAKSITDISNKLDEIKLELSTKATSDEVKNLLSKIEEKENRILSLEESIAEQKTELTRCDSEITILRIRMEMFENKFILLERDIVHNRVIRDLNSRLINDQEQISRKVNLRIEGVEITTGESPSSLMAYLKSECEKLDLRMQDFDFDHCHRNGSPFHKNGKKYQTILLKLCSWRARDIIYQNRKRLPFKVDHDLTKDRHKKLVFARDSIENDETTGKVVSFVFADKNCKLKFKTRDDKFHGFSTTEEFLTLVQKLSLKMCMSDTFREDEANNDLFY